MYVSNIPINASDADTTDGGKPAATVRVSTTVSRAGMGSTVNPKAAPPSLPKQPESERELGEGNCKAAKNYDAAAEEFANSGKVAAKGHGGTEGEPGAGKQRGEF